MGAIGVLVDQPGQNFLAGAALAEQQDREVELGDLQGLTAKVAHHGRGGEEIHAFADFDGIARAGSGRIGVLQAEAQYLVHFFFLDGLGEIVLSAEAHGLRDLASVAYAGEHDDLGRRLRFANALQRLQSVSTRHHHVEQDEVGSVAFHFVEGFQTVRGGGHTIGI